jgi:hypothetical protein
MAIDYSCFRFVLSTEDQAKRLGMTIYGEGDGFLLERNEVGHRHKTRHATLESLREFMHGYQAALIDTQDDAQTESALADAEVETQSEAPK